MCICPWWQVAVRWQLLGTGSLSFHVVGSKDRLGLQCSYLLRHLPGLALALTLVFFQCESAKPSITKLESKENLSCAQPGKVPASRAPGTITSSQGGSRCEVRSQSRKTILWFLLYLITQRVRDWWFLTLLSPQGLTLGFKVDFKQKWCYLKTFFQMLSVSFPSKSQTISNHL